MKVHRSRLPDFIVPSLDLLSLLFESGWGQAREDTKIHVEAANPFNSVTKAAACTLLKRVAHILRHHFGIGASGAGKDVVLVSLLGTPFAPVLFYGLLAAGGIYCGASTEAKVAEIVRQIDDSKATLLVCSPECEAQYSEAAQQCGISKDRVLILESNISPKNWKLSPAADRRNLLEGTEDQQLDWQRITSLPTLQSTTICLLYSSGTTGLPKGVLISHYTLVSNNVCTMAVARRYQQSHQNFTFSTIAHLPMSNIAGISLYASNPLYMGGTTYWMPSYNFELFLQYHRKYRPQYQFTVPPVWLRIAKSDAVTDQFDGLQVAVTGSAPIGQQTVKEVRKKLGKGRCLIAQTWGTTETAGVITALDWPDFSQNGRWSVGELCPNVTLRVLDEHDKDSGEGEVGELLVGGPILAQGYHDRPQANKETFVDGWYRTGDIGMIKDGHVSILDRKKELIKYKGAQLAPAELEAVLTSHEKIADAAVIGVWDEEMQTEVPRGYVVRQKGGEGVTAEEVKAYVSNLVAGYKRLRGGVYFVEEIPKSVSGKILRKELAAKAKEEQKIKAKL